MRPSVAAGGKVIARSSRSSQMGLTFNRASGDRPGCASRAHPYRVAPTEIKARFMRSLQLLSVEHLALGLGGVYQNDVRESGWFVKRYRKLSSNHLAVSRARV